MNHEQRQAFLNHIQESKDIVDGWPAWKREDSDSLRDNNHENSFYECQSVNQRRLETEAES